MSKTVYKLKPFNLYRTLYMESWLSDKAKEGLKLKNIGLYFCSFEKGEPDTTAYRIYISKHRDEIISNEIKVYRDHGWTPLTSFSRFHVFTAPSEQDATDVIQNGEAYVKMLKHYKSGILFALISILISLSLYIMQLKFTFGGIYIALAKINLFYITPLFFFLFVALCCLYDYIKVIFYRKRLKGEFLLNHHLPWKKHIYLSFFENFIFIFALALFLIISGSFDTNPKYISEVTENMPIISAIDTEPTTTLHNEEICIEKFQPIFSYNGYEGRYSAYVPANYDGKNSRGYDVIIITEVYTLKDDLLINGVIKDLAKKYFHINKNPINAFKVDNSSFDSLYVDEYMSGCKAVAVKNNTIVYVNYFGPQDKDLVLKALSEKLNSIQGGGVN